MKATVLAFILTVGGNSNAVIYSSATVSVSTFIPSGTLRENIAETEKAYQKMGLAKHILWIKKGHSNAVHVCNEEFSNPLVLFAPRLRLKIHTDSLKHIQKICQAGQGILDNGERSSRGDFLAGCELDNSPQEGWEEIWVAYCQEPAILIHELCHADGGYTQAECESMFPFSGRTIEEYR